MTRKSSRGKFFLLLIVLAINVGCGPSLQPVEGKLYFGDGGVVMSAIVEFKPIAADDFVANRTARGMTDERGEFVLTTAGAPGAYPGEYQVIVNQMIVMDGQEKHLRHSGIPTVAAKYRSYATSGLTQQIGIGPQSIELIVEGE